MFAVEVALPSHIQAVHLASASITQGDVMNLSFTPLGIPPASYWLT